MNEKKPPENDSLIHPRRIQVFLVGDILGFAIFVIGIKPELFGLNHSPVIGYLQVMVYLVGLGLVVLSSLSVEYLLRPNGRPLTIREDIGARVAATGYVLAAVSSAADLIGLGSQPLAKTPSFGVLQSVGLLLGVAIIMIGVFLYYPVRKRRPRKLEYKVLTTPQ
jgi:hypothetical protein